MRALLIDQANLVSALSALNSEAATQNGSLAAGFASGAQIVGETAVIPIRNVIDHRVSLASTFGNVVSSEAVSRDFAGFVDDPSIQRIIFDIDSPGGIYTGLPELARSVFLSRGKKPTIALANGMAASGALWLGVAASKFVSIGSGTVGSIGALIMHTDASEFFASNGIRHEIIRSPAGKADVNDVEPLTDAARENLQQTVTDIADEFVSFVATSRGVSRKDVKERFGQGRMLSAEKAVTAGLLDGLAPSIDALIGSSRSVRRRRHRVSASLRRAQIQARERRWNAQ